MVGDPEEAGGSGGRIVVLTGTTTGAGKTTLTTLLTVHLKGAGKRVRAMKPYCSGSWGDTDLLLQANGVNETREAVTPVFCERPLAPLAALGEPHATEAYERALEAIRMASQKVDILLVEGIGGLEVPLASGRTVSTLIADLGAEAIVVAQNSLGVINHVALTQHRLKQQLGSMGVQVLMNVMGSDESSRTNAAMIRETLPLPGLWELPHMDDLGEGIEAYRRNEKKVRKTLVEMWNSTTLCLPVQRR